jgi:type VI secretion system protein ImpG
MEDLLPHYERELTFLRARATDFAKLFPKIAGRLQMTGDVGDDPHVERLIESCALLTSRVHKRLDDDFPLFTESLIELLYPHYLRPFPSCSIAYFDPGALAAQMTKGVTVERGTELVTRAVKGVPCKFSTTRDVYLQPLKVVDVAYRNSLIALQGLVGPSNATSVLSLTFEKTSPQASWAAVLAEPLMLFLDGESSQVSAMRDALTVKSLGALVAFDAPMHRPVWIGDQTGRRLVPELSGFDDDEALLDWDARANSSYRLLMEYFSFPEKFNFVKLPVSCAVPADLDACGQVTIHVPIKGITTDSDASRLLETVRVENFVLGAAPVVNRFRQAADPIRVTQHNTVYPVVVDARRAFGYELYALDRVHRVRQTASGTEVDEVRPFFSLKHDDLFGALDEERADQEQLDRSRPGTSTARSSNIGYWQLQVDESLAQTSPGYEASISLVDHKFDPMVPSVDVLSLDVVATNRDLPSLLSHGTVGGDLFMEGGGAAKEIRFLRKPTRTHRFERGRGTVWRLISHLSLNHLSLSGGGVDALKEMLRLYDLPRSATNRRQIEALVAIEFKPTTAWLPGEPFATFVRGTEVRLTVDEAGFVGSGLDLFAAVLDRFFGLYVHANSFTKLSVLSARTQEVLFSCPPRNGDKPLV